MTIAEVVERLGLKVIHPAANPDREVCGGYAGDLLSWVMGRARTGSAWITIMSNRNVAAVAVFAGVSLVILAEGVPPDPELLEAAGEQDVPLYSTGLSSFEIAARLYRCLGGNL